MIDRLPMPICSRCTRVESGQELLRANLSAQSGLNVSVLVPPSQEPDDVSSRSEWAAALAESRDQGIDIACAELRINQTGAVFLRRFEMCTRVLGLTISALILAYGAVGAVAQERLMPQPDQQQAQSHPMAEEGSGTMGQGGMMGRGMMGHGMMRGGAMGPPIMFRMMFALMDGDGDGTISLTEFQVAHERIFKAMDSNKDGRLTQEEMQAFMHGTMSSAPQQ